MALTTYTFDVPYGITCADHMARVGDPVKVNLEPTKYINAAALDGTVVGVSAPKQLTLDDGTVVTGFAYTIEIDDALLPGSVTKLDDCDVFSVTCQTCCEALDEKFTTITDGHESRLAAEEAISADHESRITAIEDYLGDVPTPATTWPAIVAALNAGQAVLISNEVTVTSSETLNSGSLTFEDGGKLLTAGFTLEFNIPIINPNHFHIFDGFVLDEDYPERWTDLGTTITGDFGGVNERFPAWWGLTTTTDPNNGAQAVADANNDAIAAAALSVRAQNATGAQVTVSLPAGAINVSRPVRLDGIRARLVGQGANATQLWAQSNAYAFATTHFILTEDYPVSGATPVVEIGYEANLVSNPDEGFHGGVVEIGIICPVTQASRRVSGIMWESGLQEQTRIEFVNIQNYGGYAIGGPRFQRLEHNGAAQSYYTQLNQVQMHDLWIFSANKPDAIGMSVFGVGFKVWNVTVDHGRDNTFGGVTTSAILTGARANGHWANIRIEQGAAANGHIAYGIEVPSDGVAQRLKFDAITYKLSAPFPVGLGLTSRSLCIKASNGGVACSSITNETARNFESGNWAIEDAARGKLSEGWHNTTANGSFVARYDREESENIFYVVTTDPGLDGDHGKIGSQGYTIPTINDGSMSPVQTITVTGAALGDRVEATFSQDTQGLEIVRWVSAANTVKVRFSNQTGVVVSGIPAGTIKCKVEKV